MDDNLFDEDDALDYLLYKEYFEKDEPHRNSNGNNYRGGCLGMMVFLVLLPAAWIMIWIEGL
ncbi:hypothetical protein [Desulfolithobacter sp.]